MTDLDDDARQSTFQALQPSKFVILFDKHSQTALLSHHDDLVGLDTKLWSVDERPFDVVERELQLVAPSVGTISYGHSVARPVL